MSAYDTPKGAFNKLLAIDCETTGGRFGTDDYSVGHQAVSWGIVVADAQTLQPIEELYVEIKWNEESKASRRKDPTFGVIAANIHGLSFDYLEKHGMDEEDAVAAIGNLILKHFGPDSHIKCLGHNVHMFDVPFLRSLFRRFDIELKFGARHYDSNSIGFITGAFTSDALFATMGFDERNGHNALEDAKMSLEACRMIKVLWDAKVGVKAYS